MSLKTKRASRRQKLLPANAKNWLNNWLLKLHHLPLRCVGAHCQLFSYNSIYRMIIDDLGIAFQNLVNNPVEPRQGKNPFNKLANNSSLGILYWSQKYRIIEFWRFCVLPFGLKRLFVKFFWLNKVRFVARHRALAVA